MSILAAILALIMGGVLGLLGGGGSVMTVPILIYALDVPSKAAIATSLLVVGVSSASALIPHARAGNVAWRTGLIFGLFGMAGAFAGGRVAEFIPGTVLLVIFALLMLVTGVMMLRGKKKPASAGEDTAPAEPGELPLLKVALEGTVVGLITGIVGAGGGFLVVPALVLLGGLSMKRAIGTSLMVVSMKSFAGFAGFAGHVPIDYSLAATFTGAALAGTILGALAARKIPADGLRKGFAVFVLVMAVFIIGKQLDFAMLAPMISSPITWILLGALALGGGIAYTVMQRKPMTS